MGNKFINFLKNIFSGFIIILVMVVSVIVGNGISNDTGVGSFLSDYYLRRINIVTSIFNARERNNKVEIATLRNSELEHKILDMHDEIEKLSGPTFRLVNFEMKHSSLFSRGSCPSSKESIDAKILLSPVNKNDSIGDYIPPDLVEAQKHIRTKNDRIICLEETTAIALYEMFETAKEEGVELVLTSGFRSPQTQLALYARAIDMNGFRGTTRVAPAYHSEHQLNAVDLSGQSIQQGSATGSFGSSVEGQWVKKNGYRFGFVQSYEQHKEDITGYMPESWHWRFVGKENAKRIKESKFTLHEILTSKNTRIVSSDEIKSFADGKVDAGDSEIAG